MQAAREREKAEKAAKIERLKQDAIYTPKGGASAPGQGPAPGQENDYVPLLSLPTTAGAGGSSGVPLSKRQEMIQRVREDAIYTPKGGHVLSSQGPAHVTGPASATARGPGLAPPRGPPPSFFPPPADSATARSVMSTNPSPGPPSTSTNTIPPPRPQGVNPNATMPDSARSTATTNAYPTPRGPPPPRPLGVAPNAMMPDSARSVMSSGPPSHNPYPAPRGPPPRPGIVPPDSARSNVGAPGRPMPPPDSARSVMSTVPGPPNSNPTPRPGPPPPRPQGVNPNAMMPDSARSMMSTGGGPPRPQGPQGQPSITPAAGQGQGSGPPPGRPPGPPPRPPGVTTAPWQGPGPPPKPTGPRGPPINMFG